MDPIHRITLVVPKSALDANRHANNVAYLQWMQDAAIAHSDAVGCTEMTRAAGATWVARSHYIEYLIPALENDSITLLTWVANLRRVRSLRRYQFIRARDQSLLARGETDWVFVDATTGRPRAIPSNIASAFIPLPDQSA